LPATRRIARRLSMNHQQQRRLLLRGARRLRRGDVVVLGFAGTLDDGAAGVTRVDERWRVRL
jgi:hypothetical protein